MHGASPRRRINDCVVRSCKGHWIVSAVAVQVPDWVGKRTSPVGSESALDGGTIVCVVESGATKSIVTRNSGSAKRSGVRLFHGPRANRAGSAAGIRLDELRIAIGQHCEGKLGRTAGNIPSH